MKPIIVPIYRAGFYIINDRKKLKKFLLECGIEITNLEDYAGCCYDLGSRMYTVSVFDNKISTLIHELTHLAVNCLDNGDTYNFRNNDENLAYLIEYLCEIVFNKLKISDNIKEDVEDSVNITLE